MSRDRIVGCLADPQRFHAWVDMGVAGGAAARPAAVCGIARALAWRTWARISDGGWFGKPTLDLCFARSDWGPEDTARGAETLVAATPWGARAIMGRLWWPTRPPVRSIP
ncbi:MAG: hypothetical protein ACK6DP_16550 [Gemmatimonas sp.]|jgi:hypothetical protein|uniref:hypothetical protein n=1 Tax=Gemmatimonas sp. TaxID=1962908 RepID=UPI00391F2A4A|nr:hypothetical protein [Gemmatimonadota bacterium]